MNGLPSDLPPAARAYLDAFPAGDVIAFPITGLDRVGLPVWVVALFPDDPALDGIMPYGVGYGVDDAQAVLGSLGEIAEMVFPTLTLQARPKRRGRHRELVAALGERAVADPLTLCLPAGSPVDADTPLDWVEAKRWRDGSTVLVPVELAAYSTKELGSNYQPFTQVISNGMGAGPDLDWAIGHGLCEILQRDGNGLLFRALDRGVLLDLPEQMPATLSAIIDRYADAGVRLLPKFATVQFGLTNLYVVGYDDSGSEPPTPIMVTGCGEACHPDASVALEKALTEFASSRARKAYAHGPEAAVTQLAPPGYVDRFLARAGSAAKSSDPRAFDTMRDWSTRSPDVLRGWLADSVHAVRSHKPFGSLPHAQAKDHRARVALTRAAVEAAGFDVLYVDMSPPGGGLAVVKVIVPGMEVETMSYARIGERNVVKLRDGDTGLVGFGDPGSGRDRRPVRLTDAARDRLGGQPWFDVERAAEIVGPLYPLYREPEAHHVARALDRGRS